MFIVVGLGNPGEEYALTRHNVGFRVIDRLQEKIPLLSHRRGRYYWIGWAKIGEKEVLLVKPLIYMNLSGEALLKIKKKYGLDISHLIVVCDDVNLPPGKIRVRRLGSDGGHNGLKSVIYWLKSEEFSRIRIGIGRPVSFQQMTEYVLSPTPKNEKLLIAEAIERAAEAVQVAIQEGIEVAMNRFN